MPTTVTTPSDLTPLEARLSALEARVARLEARPLDPGAPPIPMLSQWTDRMLTGANATRALYLTVPTGPLPVDPAATYYDGDRVLQQVATYTGDAQWAQAADLARTIYRDRYVLPNQGAVPGYWNFTTGLRMAGDAATVNLLATTAAYAADSTPLAWTSDVVRSREVAYAIVSYIDQEALGAPRRTRRLHLVEQAYGHLEQFKAAYLNPDVVPVNPQPFMTALTAHALIRDWESSDDYRAIPKLVEIADLMWDKCWLPASAAMWYDELNKAPAPDLNLLIAPLYAWLWHETGDRRHLDRGDALFAGGVQHGNVAAGKHFNQNYWWSFDYVAWRS